MSAAVQHNVPTAEQENLFCIETLNIQRQLSSLIKEERLLLLSTYGSRSFAFSGPTVWNKLPDYLRNPSLSINIINRDLKTFLFAHY